MVNLRGVTWDNDRAVGPLLGTMPVWNSLGLDVSVEWSTRPLSTFAHQPLSELTEDFDLIVLDHPHIGEGADVVVLTHQGLEGFAHLRDIWAGGMVGATIRVEFWRIPRAEIPAHRPDQVGWLYDLWDRIDNWIDESSKLKSKA